MSPQVSHPPPLHPQCVPPPPSPLPVAKPWLRCHRCPHRKFRTPRDLALHILSKHGQARLRRPSTRVALTCEDAHSVTLNSPILAADEADLDALLARADPVRAAAGVHGARREECWEDACDGFEEPRVASSSEEGEKKKEEDEDEDDEDDEERRMDMRGVWDGESVGPDAKDVYIDRCRSGRVSLVPILEPVAILNFANALF